MADNPRHHDLGNAVNPSDNTNEERLRLALDASGIALWDADFVTGKVHLDARWAELVGDDPPLAVSIPFRRLLKLVDPEHREAAEAHIREARRGDRDEYRMQYRVRHRDGHWVWVESRGRVVARDAAGRAIRMIGANTDISAQKEAEALRDRQTQSLIRQKEFLEALHQTALDLLARHEMGDLLQAIVDRASSLLDAPFCELSLIESEEFVVRAFTRNQPFLRGDHVGRGDAHLSWQAVDSGEIVVVDDYSSNDERRHIYDQQPRRAVAIFPIMHGKRCLGVLGVSRTKPGHVFTREEIDHGAMLARQAALVVYNANIYDDAVRVAEARTVAMRESEERFRAVFEMSPIIVGLVSLPDGRFVEVNATGLAALGYSREEVIGRTTLELNVWVDPAERDRFFQTLMTAGSISGFEAEMRRRNGEHMTLICSARLIKLGGRTYSLNTLQDITVQKQALERLRQSHKIELLGNLAGGIAHDFNNILTGMLSNVELARLDLPSPHPARQWIDRIGATAGHAKNLVQQILTFSRMEEGKRVPARLQPAVSAAVELMRTTMPSMMRIEADIRDDCPPVLADETQIHQVVMNLCTNAWHALPEHGGCIWVSLKPAARRVVLTVRDNGCGMDAATLQRIYEPFFTTKDTGKGTGLGLAVVHGIVQSHGGTIAVESAPGKGTTFEISLPAIEAVQPSAAQPATAQPVSMSRPPRGGTERLLYVDDEQSVGVPTAELLGRLGYRITYEVDPKAALAAFEKDPKAYDLVITDLAMPGMTGREFAEKILRTRKDMPVILLTGLVDPKMREGLLHTGVRSVLIKPVTIGELAACIALSLGRDGS